MFFNRDGEGGAVRRRRGARTPFHFLKNMQHILLYFLVMEKVAPYDEASAVFSTAFDPSRQHDPFTPSLLLLVFVISPAAGGTRGLQPVSVLWPRLRPGARAALLRVARRRRRRRTAGGQARVFFLKKKLFFFFSFFRVAGRRRRSRAPGHQARVFCVFIFLFFCPSLCRRRPVFLGVFAPPRLKAQNEKKNENENENAATPARIRPCARPRCAPLGPSTAGNPPELLLSRTAQVPRKILLNSLLAARGTARPGPAAAELIGAPIN